MDSDSSAFMAKGIEDAITEHGFSFEDIGFTKKRFNNLKKRLGIA